MINKEQENIDKEFEKFFKTKESKRFAFWVLIVFFGGFLLWAAFVPLDEGVPTMGKVVVDTKRKLFNIPLEGQLKRFMCQRGDFVEKDDILMKLGDQKAQSEVFIEENNIKSLEENMNLQRISLTKVSGLTESGKQVKLVEEELDGIRG